MDPSKGWQCVEHKKFPQRLTRTQKRRLQRQRVVEGKKKEQQVQDQVIQKVEPVNKSKFKRKAIEDPITNMEESLGSSGSQELNFEGSMELDEDMDIDAFEIEGEPLHYGCATTSVMLPQEFMMEDVENSKFYDTWGAT